MRVLMALALQAMLFGATACVAIPELEHVPSPTPDLADRSDCGEILGSAFRSDNEQAWFTDNCSDWAHSTVGRLPDPTPMAQPAGDQAAGQGGADPDDQQSRGSQVAQGGSQPDQNNQSSNQDSQSNEDTRKRCDQQRGRPYASDADRDWYLKNCQNQPATTLSPDVRDCDQVRGQNYASEEQRQWFLANCLDQGPANPGAANNGQAQDQGSQNIQGSTGPGGPAGNSDQGPSDAGAASLPAIGPEGRPCSEIYGTRYRSPSERVWFSQNC